MNDTPTLSEVRILVVDDEPFIREVLVRILKQIDIEHIVEAVDGSDALSKISSANPDLIILDIMMEPMNGLQF
jgi:two-component system chemotaxis response regulator CheY